MTNSLHDRLIGALASELDRHCTDDELAAYTANRLTDNPVLACWLKDHLGECLVCRARVAMLIQPATRVAAKDGDVLKSAAHWFDAGNVRVRSVPIEAGFLVDGSAFTHGVSARSVPDHLSSPQQEWEIELPNNTSITIDVHALSRKPLLWELRVKTTSHPHVYFSLSQPVAAAFDAPTTQLPNIDLSAERIIHSAELGYSTKLQVGPGCWHMGFSSRRAGEAWSVVQLLLHDDTAALASVNQEAKLGAR